MVAPPEAGGPTAAMSAEPSRPRVAQIRAHLENEVLTQRRLAGERLDEQEIARLFGVSRTPVREAVRQLASTGLVTLIPNRGAFVSEVSPRELVQMFEVMAGLEAMAGGLAARRGTPEAVARIVRCHEACAVAAAEGDSDAYYAENSLFHTAIYAASGNDYLEAEATRLHQRLQAYRRLQLRVPRRIGQSLAEHGRIVEAIRGGDAGRAEEELRAHIAIQGERFSDFIASLASRDAAE